MRVIIGTSGYSYRDWLGQFYPSGLRPNELLPYYASQFPAVEINTSYYGIPSAATTAKWASQVPLGFEFAVKAHQDMTHADDFQPEVFAQFRDAIQPLQRARMLGAVLAQFPWRFRPGPESERYLKALRGELPDVPVVVEFRHAGWAAERTFELLRELELGYCCVDEPRFKSLMPPLVTATSNVGYLRFHGRNYQQWWKGDAKERYDYRYTESELAEWLPKVVQLAEATEKTYVFFNNHNEGNAGQNARQLALLIEQMTPKVRLAAPPEVTPIQGSLLEVARAA